jgi:hypothetical protein
MMLPSTRPRRLISGFSSVIVAWKLSFLVATFVVVIVGQFLAQTCHHVDLLVGKGWYTVNE